MDNLPITPEPVSPSPLKTSSKLVPVLLTLFILTLISLIAILYYQNQQLAELLAEKENQPTPVPTVILPTSTPAPESVLRAKIENWDLYTQAESILKLDKCTEDPEEIIQYKAELGTYSVKNQIINSLKITITPNLNNWTDQEFQNFSICQAGAMCPLKAFPENLLWIGSCGTGMMGEDPEEIKELEACGKIQEEILNLYKTENISVVEE